MKKVNVLMKLISMEIYIIVFFFTTVQHYTVNFFCFYITLTHQNQLFK